MRRRWPALIALAAVLTGCTGIPSSSSPQVVRSVDRGNGAASDLPDLAPVDGAGPRDIVAGFLTAIAKSPDAGHSAARQFLTSSAARKWQDDTTIVVKAHQVGAELPGRPAGSRTQSDPTSVTVGVTGRPVASLDSSGVVSPVLTGNGTGDAETFSYKLTRAEGQWRIDQLPPGVLIDEASFSSYKQRKLYFFDSAERTLVPDLRYSPLGGQALESWLLTQLLAGPRPELVQSVINEVPEQVGKSSVLDSDPITVELPGAAQLDGNSLDHLAAQLAYTLGPSEYDRPLRLTDSGHTVQVPSAAGPTFVVSDFQSLDPDLNNRVYRSYFIRDGAVIDGQTNTPLSGFLGQSARDLSSVALQRAPSDALQAAGVSNGSLMMGSSTGLSRVALPAGQLSRPEWRPNSDEVWIGVGSKGAIYRVRPGHPPALVQITSPLGGGLPGQVLALRFSPDGVRLAAVVREPSGVPAAWIGSVVITSGTDIRINAFEPVTPALMSVADVSWGDATKLLLIASMGGRGDDDSVWTTLSGSYVRDTDSLTPVGLLGIPTAIAAAPGQPALVSAADSIQSLTAGSGSWVNYPNSVVSLATPGINPVYCAQ
jgi:hypothetical protein